MSRTLDSCHKMVTQKHEDSKTCRNSGVTKVCVNRAAQLRRSRLIGITFLLSSEKVKKKGKENQFPSSKEKDRHATVLGVPSKIMLLHQSCGTQTSSYLCPSLLTVFNNLFNPQLNNSLKWNFRCSIFRKLSDLIAILCVSFLKNKNAFLTLLDSDTGILKSLRLNKAKEKKAWIKNPLTWALDKNLESQPQLQAQCANQQCCHQNHEKTL